MVQPGPASEAMQVVLPATALHLANRVAHRPAMSFPADVDGRRSFPPDPQAWRATSPTVRRFMATSCSPAGQGALRHLAWLLLPVSSVAILLDGRPTPSCPVVRCMQCAGENKWHQPLYLHCHL